MAEITKVTTPMIPKENMGSKLKPITDQALELTDPSKVHKADQEGKAASRQTENQNILKDSMGRAAILPLLKNANDMLQAFKKIAFLVESGVAATDVVADEQAKELLESLFTSSGNFANVLMEQDKSAVLFKGEAFDVLRDLLGKFENYPKIKDSLAQLLKIFDYNVSSQNSVKTILYNCGNILDYMFSKDRQQFGDYLQNLADMMLPAKEADAFAALRQPAAEMPAQEGNTAQAQNPEQTANTAQAQNPEQAVNTAQTQNPGQAGNAVQAQNAEQAENINQNPNPGQADAAQAQEMEQANTEQAVQTKNPPNAEIAAEDARMAGQAPQQAQRADQPTQTAQQPPQMEPKEMAQILKNNLLPLLGEIVVKYHQNEKIRDTVMVVVHNIVRVDQGTPEALDDAVNKLLIELKQVVTVPQNFEKNLAEAVKQNVELVKSSPNAIISKLADIISETLSSPEANPAMLRHAENMLISMLQNQSSLMDVLHFIIPFNTPEGKVFTELYVDPEADEKVRGQKGKSYKIFLSVETEAHGSFELGFLATGDHVDFNMWCPEELVKSLTGLKRQFSSIMQMHGYTMNSFSIEKMKAPHSVAEVFPRLLEKKVGFDVQI